MVAIRRLQDPPLVEEGVGDRGQFWERPEKMKAKIATFDGLVSFSHNKYSNVRVHPWDDSLGWPQPQELRIYVHACGLFYKVRPI